MVLSSELFRSLVDGLQDGVCVVDLDGKIIYWNNGAARLTGYDSIEVMGRRCTDGALVHVNSPGSSASEGQDWLTAATRDGASHEERGYLIHKDGHRVPVRAHISPLRDSTGEIMGAVELFADNAPLGSALQRVEELETLTLIDPLTKLPNRVYVEMSLLARINEMRRYGWTFGVLFIDVDGFKNINDHYGHNAGDEVLKVVGKALLDSTRPFDVLGRWGGDEFVAVIVYATEEHLRSIANRYRQLVEAVTIPAGPETIKVTLSIGATLARPDDNVVSVYKRADGLMYESKNTGRNRVTIKA